MYGFPLFARLALLAFSTNKGRLVPLTPGRLLLQCVFVPALFLARLLHSLAFFLDDIFFPAYRRIQVKEPVFVVGIPRSGTTLLHRVLAKDTDQFTTFTFWELLLAPAIIERKCISALARADKAMGCPGRRLLGRLDEWLLGDFGKMHHLSLFEPEEDEWLLMHRFASGFLLFAFPFMDKVRHLIFFDEQVAPEDKKQIMAFHKRCVQRHLYVHGAEKRLLSKNPSFSAKLDAINTTYPDAKIVCCVRNPYEVVPSFASLLAFVWGQQPGQVTWTDGMRQTLLDVVGHFYRHPMERLPELPEDRHASVLYDALTKQPKNTVTGLYGRFGFPVGRAFEEELDAQEARSRAYNSKHTYSLEEYGLIPEDILEGYRDIFEHYGFSTDHDGSAL